MRNCLVMVAILVMASGRALAAEDRFEPAGIFLTWADDPTTTIVIDFHTDRGEERASAVDYRRVGEDEWQRAEGDARPFPHADRTIHRTHLADLSPATTYEFRFGDDSRSYRFQTMPEELSEPLRFVTGGDTRHRQSWMERTNLVAMEYEPHFIVWGGDLAYANGRASNVERWIEWFDAVTSTLVDDEGRVVPIVVGIGNHEVRDGYYHRHDDYQPTDQWRRRVAPYFYGLFEFPGQPGYAALDFGDYLSLILLDSDHTNPIDGVQTSWLATALDERDGVPFVFPVYHVAGFPSHRRFDGGTQRRVREHWVPLFERHNVRVAFENHDHTYKRTYPIRGGEVAEDGIVYIGDGAWGVGTRRGNSRDEWYIEKFASERHAIIVTLRPGECEMVMVSEAGDVLDEFAFEVE